MRAFIAFSLLLAGGLVGAEPISWSAARLLSWDDFTGPVPASADASRVATTATSLAWSYEYALEMSGSSCRFRITRIDSAAEFHPETSWVRDGHRTSDVLEHEQGHFDIAQRYKILFDREAAALVNQEHACRAGNERRAVRYAQRTIEELVGSLYDDTWRRYREEQSAYDAETRHGIDRARQQTWTEQLEPLRQTGDRH